jgi:hypothetical protein
MKLLLAFLALLIGCSAGEIAGKWNIVVPARDGNQIKYQLVLRSDGGAYSGFISSEEGDAALSDIKVSDAGLTFKIETDNATYAVKATVDGDSMKGEYSVNGNAGGTFTATRSKE